MDGEDAVGEDSDSLPQFFCPGQWLTLCGMEPGQTPGQDHEPFDCHRPGLCRGCPGLEDAPFGRADTAHRDLVLADEAARGLIAPRAREMGEIPDPEGGDGVIGEAFAQIVGGIEMAVFDPRALFEGMEEAFDAPAQFVPPQHGGCRLQVRLPLSAERGAASATPQDSHPDCRKFSA